MSTAVREYTAEERASIQAALERRGSAPWRNWDREVDEQVLPGIGAGTAVANPTGGFDVEISKKLAERAEMAGDVEALPHGGLPVSDRLPTQQTQEILAELKEGNIAASRGNRLPDQDELEEGAGEAQRCVNRMGVVELDRRLRALRLAVKWYEHPWPNCLTLAVEYHYLLAKPDFSMMVQSPMWEWSTMRTDAHGLRDGWKYIGWRRVLLLLLFSGILTEAQIESGFPRAEGRAGYLWRKQLYGWRHRPEKS